MTSPRAGQQGDELDRIREAMLIHYALLNEQRQRQRQNGAACTFQAGFDLCAHETIAFLQRHRHDPLANRLRAEITQKFRMQQFTAPQDDHRHDNDNVERPKTPQRAPPPRQSLPLPPQAPHSDRECHKSDSGRRAVDRSDTKENVAENVNFDWRPVRNRDILVKIRNKIFERRRQRERLLLRKF